MIRASALLVYTDLEYMVFIIASFIVFLRFQRWYCTIVVYFLLCGAAEKPRQHRSSFVRFTFWFITSSKYIDADL